MALLLERLRAHLDRARLFPAPGSAVLAVSGGPDSVALLDLMLAVARERGLSLVVAHADHGIRADSRTVGQSVGELARRSGLPFELGELELGPGATETAARRARYAWLALVQRRHAARYLVTAHHADDQVEMILLRVLKGSGPAGLAGMPARGRGGIVRPLLPFNRAELREYVAERGLAFHDDPANRDPRHLRSWLRVTLLPQLATRLGGNLRSDVLRLGRAAAFDRLRVSRSLPGAATQVVASGERGSAVFGGFRVEWAPGPAPARLPRSDWTTWIAGSSWEVRAPRSGDRLVPVGGVGHRPVRRLLMEARVPRSSRASYPVVARGETILWVPGICRSAADLPRAGTRAVRLHVTECSEPQADGRA